MACFPFLFQDIIYKVKTVFNGEFEIIRVKERNVRLREIILDLELEETIWQPEFEDCEKPERTLVVEDHEVLASMSPFPSLSDFPSYCLLVLFILQEVY
jgi:hypothetical protein